MAKCTFVGSVNYRKQSSESFASLLPLSDFRLYAVCARYPQGLAQEVTLTPIRQGVYDVVGFGLRIRVIVANQLPEAEHNAMLHLFSAREELLKYGQAHYKPHSQETSSLLYRLFRAYSEEADMPEKLKEFVRETIDELLNSLPAEELRKHLPVEERLKGLPAEELRKHLPVEERLKGLTAEEVAKALSPETLEALARQLNNNGASKKAQ